MNITETLNVRLRSAFMTVSIVFMSAAACAQDMTTIIERSLANAGRQSLYMCSQLDTMVGRLPKTIDRRGRLTSSDSRWWCSGFFPGTLWYLYENLRDDRLLNYARIMTDRVEREKLTTDNHDVGFMIYCSFGNGERLFPSERYEEVLTTAAHSLSTRFNQAVGCIRSWNTKRWTYPVIIDNMMNLELLMWAFHHTHDSTFYNIAVSHADKTMKHHYRDDYSTWHVVSYDPVTGLPNKKQTHQGYSDSSAWARGQGWSLYGFTMMYRETGLKHYLERAVKVAAYIMNHPSMPDDGIPYWDFNAPGQPDCKRDASAAAIIASALIELSDYDKANADSYRCFAEKQLRTLASDIYTAEYGTNGGFILKHSVGNYPGKSEVDVPLTYADYYYIEALTRYKKRFLNKE